MMTSTSADVFGGVDTHGRTHHAAAIDGAGHLLDDAEFPATAAGYRALLAWLAGFGRLVKVGVEGTGTYGAGLARHLADQGIEVIEVDRPDRKTRRRQGKSDPIDAVAAARAVLAGAAIGAPKTRTGPVEAIRALRVARRGAVKARTAGLNQAHGLVVSAPEQLRAELTGLRTSELITRCAGFRIDAARLLEPVMATKAALRAIARRVQTLDEEIALADARLRPAVATVAPRTYALLGAGPDVAGQLLVTAGDNPERLRSDAALAHLTGISPLPASSGRTDRHRLNRGGDRAANSAVHRIVLCRMRYHEPTRAYVERRTTQGLSKTEIMRCLKRYIVREVHTALLADFEHLTQPA
jgi:transposase